MKKTKRPKLKTDWMSLVKCSIAAYKEVGIRLINKETIPEIMHLRG